MFTLLNGARRFIYNSHFLYYIRIIIALTGTTLFPWILGQEPKYTIPLTLGVVAAALTDLDDRLVGRLKNLVITLCCFLLASASIGLLYPYPILFFCGLAISTWGFILLGALGQRYATIAFGALLIAIYTMLGMPIFPEWYEQPVLLLLGAIWYNSLTLIGHLLFPIRPVQDNLTRCYQQLATYLEAKATLFDPDIEDDYQHSLYNLAMANSQLIDTMNQTKVTLLSRLKGDRGQRSSRFTLHYYFVAQDIHERASSSHAQYQLLSNELRHSDVLFRFQRLLSMQARACEQVAQSILWHKKYQHNPSLERAINYLENALNHLKNTTSEPQLITPLNNLLQNLQGIDALLRSISTEQYQISHDQKEETQLSDDGLTGWRDIALRIKEHLTPKSALFRHAVRMSLVLCIGYAIIQFFQLDRGYWILLTSLFVCQPNYNATRRRLTLRVSGTIIGILIGFPILYFVPSIEGQLVLIVITGTLFFAFRTIQYAHATLFITLLVLLSFNLLGEGYDVALPRIIDTLIGCAIAWFAVSFIWPDWKFRQLPVVIQKTMTNNCYYLDAILIQYYQGKDNSLSYRIARRNAHSSDGELASLISNMSSEPKSYQASQEVAFQLLCLNHTLLSYISALGVHRSKIEDENVLTLLNDTVCYIDSALRRKTPPVKEFKQSHVELIERINLLPNADNPRIQLVLTQIRLLLDLLPQIINCIQIIEQSESKNLPQS
ncbi:MULTISPECIES: YccS family putative transporter [Proteus]|uniref:TIGR01666 family membrane protein n=1 Tax=Proteus penneri TaxID=102862 RepID=A0ABS0W3Q4_9GAMM|nr:YccS family putative transporter [Proteus penneri]NBM80311.1 TIGR01666 family membrane protein [Proteus sp. G2659]NBN04666.1 TIGR01666 family membrane protein [Proteus sp. G2665]NBN24355.1 TIGR01666 family membrane protein [Proteus sp. G2657]MBJ2117931.1 TIGR01666 family membrane protein [Proteus penneri]SUB99860.1 Inner membrane protein yccS [Proteus penneri]